MTQPHHEFVSNHVAFHITFRCYGTWLHGDSRGSIDRFHNRYGTPDIPPNEQWKKYNERNLKRPPVNLQKQRRAVVTEAVREICDTRKWCLWTVNVRTNHVHTVVTAHCDPELVLIALKAHATRKMREARCWDNSKTPWARGGSKKRLWTEKQLYDAIAYVEYEQGEPLE